MIISDPAIGVEWDDLLTGETKHGTIVNSHYCPVSSEWYLLVAEDGGRFHNIKASDLTARVSWQLSVIDVDNDDDSDDNDDINSNNT